MMKHEALRVGKMMMSFGLGLSLLVGCEEKKPQVDTPPPAAEVAATNGEAQPTTEPTKEVSTDKMIEESRKFGHVPISGKTSREVVLEKFGTWSEKMTEAQANPEAASALAEVPPGAKVTVLFGTWCSDCYNTLPGMWKTFDAMEKESLPFEIEYIAVDERLQVQGMDISKYELRNIPTIVVERDGKEVGRFIEKSDAAAEMELVALLTGKKTGVISTNQKIIDFYGLEKKETP